MNIMIIMLWMYYQCQIKLHPALSDDKTGVNETESPASSDPRTAVHWNKRMLVMMVMMVMMVMQCTQTFINNDDHHHLSAAQQFLRMPQRFGQQARIQGSNPATEFKG